jgi:hypothetical protein
MPKTTTNTKKNVTRKPAKTTKVSKTAKPRQNAKKVVAQNVSLLERAQSEPLELVKDVASTSLRLGLGLGAVLLDSPQDIKLGAFRGNLRQNLRTLVSNAINKGEKIEQRQINWLSNFEREQRKRINEFLAARKRDLERTEHTLEEKIEEVIASLDIPTRSDIHQLNRRLNDLSKELARQRTAATRPNKKAAKPAPASTKETEVTVQTTNA